ncbi:uncharacterized protein LOC127851406 isoform X2 [Dreissena polymorpha]|uniref:uncharacterized protein LOC127851406 isoform X2 n=1 Tax=Dreissena polymorpha TaxID=45954 RepID=UPI002263CE71|nr:uncharacterized protein LOC127851406 isoform X2 [Dreissena polymorpha]
MKRKEYTHLALYKPVNQTDTSGEALATLAVDGNASTCSQTTTVEAEWIVDLMDYYILQEVTILPEFSAISQWGSGLEAFSSEQPEKWAQFIMHKNGGSPWMPQVNDTQPYIEVTYQQVVQVSGVDIHELYRSGSVKAITCKADGRWITLWSTAPNNSLSYGRIFSPELHSTCISNFIRLEFEVLDYEVAIKMLFNCMEFHKNKHSESKDERKGCTRTRV